jgi:hypothetical protein
MNSSVGNIHLTIYRVEDMVKLALDLDTIRDPRDVSRNF